MIDGFKIVTKQFNNSYWINNSQLSFCSKLDENTGEVLDGGAYAIDNGLSFTIYPYNETQKVESCYIRGSLAKYFNNGLNNAFDFDMQSVKDALNNLKHIYNLDLDICTVHGLEIGFNIYLPITVEEFLQNLKHLKGSGLSTIYKNRKVIGRKVEFQQYSIKIYDKGKQQSTNEKNFIRFEIAVNKMQFLKSYNIIDLKDIQDSYKIKSVALSLVEWVRKSIYYEKSMKYKSMSNFEQKKWIYFGNSVNWERYTRKQKDKANNYFNRLISDYCTHSIKNEVVSLMIEKINILTLEKEQSLNQNDNNLSANKRGRFNQGFKEITAQKRGRFNPLDEGLNCPPFTIIQKESKCMKIPPKKIRFCKSCNSEMKAKRKGAKYCNKKCNNRYNGMKRTGQNKKRIKEEKQNLYKLLKLVPKRKMILTVSYKSEGVIYSDTLSQNEIQTTKEWIRSVQKVIVTEYRKNSKPVTLTSYRSRQLVKEVNSINIKTI